MIIKEIHVKTVLSRSRIYGVDYSINPYTGCEHGCVYCYARFMLRFIEAPYEWGDFVYVKINAPRVLFRELRYARRGLVLLSSVCDPYQPVEQIYELTRKILSVLLRKDFPITILTKSNLVLRDVDLIQKFSEKEVGFTIVTLDEEVRRIFEPKSSRIIDRLEALSSLKEKDIDTFAFLGPILPYITEETLDDLFRELSYRNVDRILVDRLNIKSGNWAYISKALMEYDRNLFEKFKNALFNQEYYENIRIHIKDLALKYKLRLEFCY